MFQRVLSELQTKIPKDKKRKVCSQCFMLGHGINSKMCKVNIQKREKLKTRIKEYILQQDCLSEKTNEEHFEYLCQELNISMNKCKGLYDEISLDELCSRVFHISTYIESIQEKRFNCYDCENIFYDIQKDTQRQWKGNRLCDSCWSKYSKEREELWKEIEEYKNMECHICGKTKGSHGERFHYDHTNMFDKGDSICSMINEGIPIEEIKNEVDKCQVLCLSCHHMVSDIERKMCFTRIKQYLTRALNNNEIDEDVYEREKSKFGKLYEIRMNEIYEELRKVLR